MNKYSIKNELLKKLTKAIELDSFVAEYMQHSSIHTHFRSCDLTDRREVYYISWIGEDLKGRI